ncbi:alpha/beta hydrolase family protein [Flammeovirga kamogawensis]|uniref:Alpha/beta hydrolase n=1 Tax=Flammeovirga kamogawensis TaxID=373891 RepID=A0ABX8GWN1_9BACT|nr:lipase family protein [Flammeovirga kamogawensis]MBB6460653.1 pimeloyl-ACP methyl ester carboxylesterase [Flammeovirga kamogawensis]QWG08008.1 hypothetical protein KM029_03480 [Flammeovirga kamogawensis]TRX69815.1 hypothetical protein EO216_17420 [Flammeovirga kamogawensis]
MSFILKRLFLLLPIILFYSCSTDNSTPEPISTPVAGDLISYEVKNEYAAEDLKFLASIGGFDRAVPLIKNDITTYKVTYLTSDKYGQLIEASGIVSFPETAPTKDWILLSRGTIIASNEAPSVTNLPSYEIGASLGYAIIVPDLIGFGDSEEIFQYYFIKDKSTETSINLTLAAKTLANKLEIDTSDNYFLAGYSQGGFSSLSIAEKLLESEIEQINVLGCFTGAGGYNLPLVMNEILKNEQYESPAFLALIVLSYYEYYDFDFELSDIFKSPYHNTIQELLSGKLNTPQVNNQLPKTLNTLFTNTFLTDLKNEENSNPIYQKLQTNSVSIFETHFPIYFYHSPFDEIIPYSSSENISDNFLKSNSNIFFEEIEGTSHSNAALYMLIKSLEQISMINN